MAYLKRQNLVEPKEHKQIKMSQHRKKRRIMVVDDDGDFLKELEDMLLFCGYEVEAVTDERWVLARIRRNLPDLILMDLQMPRQNGFQLANKIKSLAQLRRIPLVAMSGYFGEEHEPLFQAYGIKEFIQKPFSEAEIVSTIEKSCSNG